MDVAIKDGKIASVAPEISSELAKEAVDARSIMLYGLVDIHTHISSLPISGLPNINADDHLLRAVAQLR